MNLFYKSLLFAIFSVCLITKQAFSAPTKGYKIASDKKVSMAYKCNSSSDSSKGDDSLCELYSKDKGASCDIIPSTEIPGNPIYMCNPFGEQFCFKDSDCQILGKQTCVVKPGSTKRFSEQYSDTEDVTGTETVIGICASIGGNKESNPMVQAVCNFIAVVTGGVGKVVVCVVIMFVGVSFFLGKVSWGLVLAIGMGAGAIFGAGQIVAVVTGGSIRCSK